MKNTSRLLSYAIFCLLAQSVLCAQQNPSHCNEMQYEHHNMVDYGPLRISIARGVTKDFQGFVVPHACVGIFSETNQAVIATAQADTGGQFEIRNIPDGKYRLVVASEGLCTANVLVILKNQARGKKRLVVTMKPSSVDVCSYVEWK